MISDFDPNPSEHDSNPDPFEHAKGCGQRLRDARMAVGLTVEDVATSLRMPIQIVRSLEEEKLAASRCAGIRPWSVTRLCAVFEYRS